MEYYCMTIQFDISNEILAIVTGINVPARNQDEAVAKLRAELSRNHVDDYEILTVEVYETPSKRELH